MVIFAVIIVAFCSGYFIVSTIIKNLKSKKSSPDVKNKSENRYVDDSENVKEKYKNNEYEAKENIVKDDNYFCKVLGLEVIKDIFEIKEKYRILVSQYHPDKVAHLGPKLQKAALEEVKKINEAFEYFKKKYKFK